MYPRGQLETLAAVKAELRLRIARRREECIEQAAVVTRPLALVDHLHGQWLRIAPLAKLAIGPIGIWLFRSFTGKRKEGRSGGGWVSQLFRWGPALWGVFRNFTRFQPEPPPDE